MDRGHLSTETITSFRILRICIFNSPKEDRFVVYKSGEGYGIVRLHNDGELYQPALAEAIDTAQATDISINDIAEKAYTVKWKKHILILKLYEIRDFMNRQMTVKIQLTMQVKIKCGR